MELHVCALIILYKNYDHGEVNMCLRPEALQNGGKKLEAPKKENNITTNRTLRS